MSDQQQSRHASATPDLSQDAPTQHRQPKALSAGRAVAAQTDLVLTKAWLISNLGCCDICQDNADAGYIPIDDEFPSGDDGTPGHPNCRCDTALHAEDPADPDSSDEE